MAENIGNQVSKIEPLTGNNYLIWALKVSAVLKSRRLYKPIIEGVEVADIGAPDSPERKAREKWEEQNDDAFGIIILTLAASQAALFINESDAKKVWLQLKNTYAGNAEDRKIDIMMELKDLKMREEENVDAFITRAKCISSRCSSLGLVIENRELVYHIVRGLNSKMDNIASILRPQRSLSLEEVQQALTEEETRLVKNRSTRYDQGKFEKAYKAKEDRGRTGQGNNKRCFVCQKVGHLANQCWHRKPEEKGQMMKLRYNQNTNYQGNRKYHGARNEHAKVASDNHVEHAFKAYEEITFDQGMKNWNLDSGCTSHMSPYSDWMSDMEVVNSEVKLAGEDNQIEVEGKGNIKISTTTSEGKTRNICINNVLYVPKLRTNLLSVRCLVSQGNKVIFDEKGASILNKANELIAEAKEINRMYIVKMKENDYSDYDDAECMNVEKKQESKMDENEMWHRRLGHVNLEYLHRMQRLQMVRGLEISKLKPIECEPCILGKLTKSPFESIEQDSATHVLELIHMDLCGPMPQVSLGGSRYVYVLVDSFSRRTFVYFLKTKDEAYPCFEEFKNRRENETQYKIKRVRTDNGTEFVNHKFAELFRKEGIHHQKTTYYTPQSNGVAERTNRTLLNKARAMLIDSNLPLNFWAEAIATAAYTNNCSPTKHGVDQTPLELWTGRTPSVKHLRVFGCVTFYCIPKELRNKLEPTAKKGIFIGYAKNRKAYRLFNVEENKIQEVRNVKFQEGTKGGSLIQEVVKGKEQSGDNQQNAEMWLNENLYDMLNDNSPEDQTIDEPVPPEQNHQPIVVNNPGLRPGRKQGETKEALREKHQLSRRENESQLIREGARRSERLKSANNQANVTIADSKVPTCYEEVESSTFKNEWHEAMDEEINSLRSHEVWRLIPREPHMKVIKNKWIYSLKRNPDGTVDKRKARLVAAGYNNNKETNHEDSFSPVIRMESFRALIAIASHKRMIMRQYDVKTAYLHAAIKGEVYMEQPTGYMHESDESKICELKKGLYGLAQSGKNWNEKITKELLKCGLTQLESEPCIYFKQDCDKLFIIGLYVDDIIVLGTDDDFIDSIMDQLKEVFVMTETRTPKMFLGIEIEENKLGINLSQKKYVENILARFGLEDCNPTKTPGDPRQDLDQHDDSEPVNKTHYQEMIGSLMYLANGTRPDINYHVSKLSQYLTNPKAMHLVAVKRVYRYLKGTMDKRLFYDRQNGSLSASADASWNNNPDAKSYSGYAVKLSNSLISWKSKKQSLVALSTCEAEMMSVCECVREVKWIVGVLTELKLESYVNIPIKINSDSKSAIDWIKGIGPAARTKHINRKYYFIRDEYKKGNIQLEFEKSEEMEADLLTKSLCEVKTERCNQKLGNVTELMQTR